MWPGGNATQWMELIVVWQWCRTVVQQTQWDRYNLVKLNCITSVVNKTYDGLKLFLTSSPHYFNEELSVITLYLIYDKKVMNNDNYWSKSNYPILWGRKDWCTNPTFQFFRAERATPATVKKQSFLLLPYTWMPRQLIPKKISYKSIEQFL